ncbi:hypothetical protein K8I61_10240 [bacterium]|nr:hypothetical protein [bacterium]
MRGFRWFGLMASVILALSVVAFGCGDDDDDDDDAYGDDDDDDDDDDGGDIAVDAEIFEFDVDPAVIDVLVGESVRWTNTGDVAHTVTSGDPGDGDAGSEFDGEMSPGESFTHTFDTVGEFSYFCGFHPDQMSGFTVNVSE